MTDQAPLLPLMLMNREDNGVSERDVHVVDLDWCREKREVFPPLHARTSGVVSSPSEIDTFGDAQKKTLDPHGEFDVILCSDLIYSGYQRDPCTPLVETLNRCVVCARSLLVALYTHTHTLVCLTFVNCNNNSLPFQFSCDCVHMDDRPAGILPRHLFTRL